MADRKDFPNDLLLGKNLTPRQEKELAILKLTLNAYYHCLFELLDDELEQYYQLTKKAYPDRTRQW